MHLTAKLMENTSRHVSSFENRIVESRSFKYNLPIELLEVDLKPKYIC